ncbi:MAG: hypothetical protein AB7D51_15835, partial [Desulfovibrionaceae bacterium]
KGWEWASLLVLLVLFIIRFGLIHGGILAVTLGVCLGLVRRALRKQGGNGLTCGKAICSKDDQEQ